MMMTTRGMRTSMAAQYEHGEAALCDDDNETLAAMWRVTRRTDTHTNTAFEAIVVASSTREIFPDCRVRCRTLP
jgi:hypothetical protein